MESGSSWGLESTPKEVLQNFLGGESATSCGGSNPPDLPSNTALFSICQAWNELFSSGSTLLVSEEIRSLGVTINRRLTFQSHIFLSKKVVILAVVKS